MKRFLKKDKLLVLSLHCSALLVSLVPIAGRMQTEENNKYYDMCPRLYRACAPWRASPEMSEDEWLDLFTLPRRGQGGAQ